MSFCVDVNNIQEPKSDPNKRKYNKDQNGYYMKWYRSYRATMTFNEYVYLVELKKKKSSYTLPRVGKMKTDSQLLYESKLKINFRSLKLLQTKYSLEEWKEDLKSLLNGNEEVKEKLKKCNRVYG